MSSSKHKKRHTAGYSVNNPTKKNSAVPALHQLTNSFEEAQFLCLQNMIDRLAANILDSLNGQEKNDPSTIMPQLRIYAQYMNLYMKFKEKCITSEPSNPHQAASKTTSADSVPQKHTEPKGLKSSPSTQFNSLDRINHKPGPNQMPHENTGTALLMPPENGTGRKQNT